MATLEEIAREAGVSRYTVSNVLRGRNKENWACTAERAERIRAIAARLNYRPNAAAVATATGRFGAIGLLASRRHPHGALLDTLLNSVRHHLTERELHLTLGNLPTNLSPMKPMCHAFCANGRWTACSLTTSRVFRTR
jgi:LacI family transcriptional regulator